MLTNNPEAPMTEEKPNEAGLWTRDGKFYRVWFDGHYDRIQSIDPNNGFSGDHNYLKHENTPTGNWRKLTPEPVTNEAAREEFLTWLKNVVEESSTARVTIAAKAAEIFGRVQQTITRLEGEIEELKAERDQLHRTREKLEGEVEGLKSRVKQFEDGVGQAINDKLTKVHPVEIAAAGENLKHARLAASLGMREFAEHCGILPSRYCNFENGNGELNVAEVWAIINSLFKSSVSPPEPAVIEGRGQRVDSEVACYMEEWPDGCIQLVRFGPDSIFKAGYRYMRCPTFPPRESFTPPPKPEILIRHKVDGKVTWVWESATHANLYENERYAYPKSSCEVLNG